jgi:hypothetical protein
VRRARSSLEQVRTALENLMEVSSRIHAEFGIRTKQVIPPTVLSTVDFPQVEKLCRYSPLVASPKVPDPRGYRTSRRGKERRWGEIRGVGLAEGSVCSSCPPRLRRTRDVRWDRYLPERIHLAKYLDLVRNLAHRDLQMVRLWQSLLEGRTLSGRLVRATGWRPVPIRRLRVSGSRL